MESITTLGGTVKQTDDYSIFKKLKGNREPDEKHVNLIRKNMLLNGNLTSNFPIVVNENMEVVDGQHRVEALKTLSWPVFYRVEEHLNIDNVRAINRAARNWSWKDYAESYASLGKVDYRRFLNLHEEFGYGYGVLARYCGLDTIAARKNGVKNGFNDGDMVIPTYERTHRLLKQCQEISVALSFYKPQLYLALYLIMNSPEYDHTRMLNKAKQFEGEFKREAGIPGYVLAIEKIYNYKMGEENRARFTY